MGRLSRQARGCRVGPGDHPATAKPPAVFVSYASHDRRPSERLQAQLSGTRVWMSGSTKERLESGDPWWPVIEQNIATCDVFVPVISANTNKRDEGIFIREWNRALERLRGHGRTTARFIHPVIVDDTAEGAVTFSGFQQSSITLAPPAVSRRATSFRLSRQSSASVA